MNLRDLLFSFAGKSIALGLVIAVPLALGSLPFPFELGGILGVAFTTFALFLICELKAVSKVWVLLGFLGGWIGAAILIFVVKGRPERAVTPTPAKLTAYMAIALLVGWGYTLLMTRLYEWAMGRLQSGGIY